MDFESLITLLEAFDMRVEKTNNGVKAQAVFLLQDYTLSVEAVATKKGEENYTIDKDGTKRVK